MSLSYYHLGENIIIIKVTTNCYYYLLGLEQQYLLQATHKLVVFLKK